jgi:hypothetical protein
VTYNLNLVHDYYTTGGTTELSVSPTPAQEGRQGYQVKFGPTFLQPLGEFEFFQVYNPELHASKEITEFKSKLPVECHHWALRTISPAGAIAMGHHRARADFRRDPGHQIPNFWLYGSFQIHSLYLQALHTFRILPSPCFLTCTCIITVLTPSLQHQPMSSIYTQPMDQAQWR